MVEEAFVGITEFVLDSCNGGSFSSIPLLKHRHRDFIVQEISLKGEIATLSADIDLPKDKESSKSKSNENENSKSSEKVERPEFDVSEGLKELESILDNDVDKSSIRVLVKNISKDPKTLQNESEYCCILSEEKEKSKRTKLHQVVRKYFGEHLVTDTVEATKIRVTLFAKTKVKKVDWRSAKRLKITDNSGGKKSKMFIQFTLYKENMETHFVLNKIEQFLAFQGNSSKSRKRNDRSVLIVGVAGTKDKRGITTQFVTLNRRFTDNLVSKLKCFRMNQVRLSNFCETESLLTLGDLKGNRFVVTLRQMENEDEKIIEKRVKSLRADGFLNYFGLQRFGVRKSVPTFLVGMHLLGNNFEAVLELMFKPDSDSDTDIISEVKKKIWARLQKKQKLHFDLLKQLPNHMTSEKAILKSMIKQQENADVCLKSVFKSIPFHLKSLYVHSLQSVLFNFALSARKKSFGCLKVVIGDLVQEDVEKKICIATKENIDSFIIDNVILPVPGSESIYPELKEIGKEFYVNSLHELGVKFNISQDELKIIEHNLFNPSDEDEESTAFIQVKGSVRHFIVKVSDLKHEMKFYSHLDQELYQTEADADQAEDSFQGVKENDASCGKALQLTFSLPSSSYATMLFRELTLRASSLNSAKGK